MLSARSRHNPYRPGTPAYDWLHEADLKRLFALAQANVDRAKTPKTRRRAKQRAAAAQRSLRKIERRREFRAKLNYHDQSVFDHLPIKLQERLMKVTREYPDSVPKDIPDPFIGPKREALWRLSYSTRTGIRLRATA
jgi:hypothetical protein